MFAILFDNFFNILKMNIFRSALLLNQSAD